MEPRAEFVLRDFLVSCLGLHGKLASLHVQLQNGSGIQGFDLQKFLKKKLPVNMLLDDLRDAKWDFLLAKMS